MYFQCKAKSREAGKELAHKHFTKQVRELGWTRWTTLNEIRPPKRANDPAPHKTVSPDTLPAKRTAGSSNTKRKSGTQLETEERLEQVSEELRKSARPLTIVVVTLEW